jgi:phosphatidylglycerol:prolipoprotein diacylglycerol transferase
MHPFITVTRQIYLDSWWVMMTLALIAGSLTTLLVLRKEIGWARALLMILVMAWGALFGAHLGHYMFHPTLFRKDPLGVLVFWGDGQSFLGSIAFCLVLLSLLSGFVRSVKFWPAADAFALGIPAGLFFARLGCFLKGCCWGTPIGDAHPLHGLAWKLMDNRLTALHPVQLYGSMAALLIFMALLLLRKTTRTPGILSAAFLMLYGVARFVLEFFRADSGGHTLFGFLTTHQEICLMLFPVGAVLLFLRVRAYRH